MLLLSDESQVVQRHNEEIRSASDEAEKYRKEVSQLLDELLLGDAAGSSSNKNGA